MSRLSAARLGADSDRIDLEQFCGVEDSLYRAQASGVYLDLEES